MYDFARRLISTRVRNLGGGAQAQINGMVGPDGMSSGPNQVLAQIGFQTMF